MFDIARSKISYRSHFGSRYPFRLKRLASLFEKSAYIFFLKTSVNEVNRSFEKPEKAEPNGGFKILAEFGRRFHVCRSSIV